MSAPAGEETNLREFFGNDYERINETMSKIDNNLN
jgi:hypothetical protein